MRLCGPKLSTCFFVLACWGTIMLLLLGIFFQTKSVMLLKDIGYDEERYESAAMSCFIAGGVYFVIGGLSYWQKVVNDRYSALEPETTTIMF
ncbi:hypothetical protein ACHWQZ_G007346 [Mnemiopsis leidyi]